MFKICSQAHLHGSRSIASATAASSHGLWLIQKERKDNWACNKPVQYVTTTAARKSIRALQGEQQGGGGRERRRLIDFVRAIPALAQDYFKSPFRKALFGGISLLGGFYVAQTISLSFGALGVNDVIAAVLCVLFTEYVTRFYYTRARPSFPVALLNNFKMGFSYGLFIDAFKLAS